MKGSAKARKSGRSQSAVGEHRDRLLRRKILLIVRRLSRVYGPRYWSGGEDPVDELVGTILSQNTNDANSDVAFEQLTRRWRNWQQVADASVEDIADAIRSGGLARQKARAIKAALCRIKEDFGSITLRALEDWPAERAMDYLTSIPGVGPKTAACVLMFSFGKPVLPVDTHIHRVARRLSLVPANASRVKAQQILGAACPPEVVYPFHVLMIKHGRIVCKAQRPACPACVLNDMCPSVKEQSG